jgi:hypothetical protein
MVSHVSEATTSTAAIRSTASRPIPKNQDTDEDLSQGVLPDVLMTMRQKIESLTLFDSDMMKLAESDQYDDTILQETRDSLKRSSQQSLSAAVLVSLAHKRYERRRLAAMEIEKVVRSLVHQDELDRVRAILLLLADDYVRSTSEDARKGGVVALAACAIGLKKATQESPKLSECRDLILASVVHACQDHSQRVRYYATESLFNVVKVMPSLAVQHFFILFEILRALYADVDVDVRSGAELLDKKLKEVIVGAINSGSFTADACVPIFARFVYIRNKATKRLTLTWLQELNEKLIGAPVLEFLHLFLGGIFSMIADPNISIRQSALAFLQSVLPKLLMDNEAFDDNGASMKVDFDKLIQSLVTTLEHPDPFVRKVAMYWVCRIVKAYMGEPKQTMGSSTANRKPSAASMSVRKSLPHLLPGILLSIGDSFHTKDSTKDSFLPDQTTRSLAEQTNVCLQEAVRRDGEAYATYLGGFIMTLREELDSPGHALPVAVERKQYRVDVTPDGTGIESAGWFRAAEDTKMEEGDTTTKSRLCALEWVTVLYESVVPDVLKAEVRCHACDVFVICSKYVLISPRQFAREFINPIIHQLVDNPPELITFKSLEVLAKITVPVEGEVQSADACLLSNKDVDVGAKIESPLSKADVDYALEILDTERARSKSRDREVFSALISLHAHNHHLLADLSRVLQFMCTLQPAEFVFLSFAVELDRFVRKRVARNAPCSSGAEEEKKDDLVPSISTNCVALATDLHFVSSFVQQMSHVVLCTEEAKDLRDLLQDCIGIQSGSNRDRRRTRLFHILLYSFSHNLVSSISLCLWAGAFRTASVFLQRINPLDINLVFLVELDQLVELLERPLFRHFHIRMLQTDADPGAEGSGAMLYKALKLILMIVPQSTCYRILRDRLFTLSRFRQSALIREPQKDRGGSSQENSWLYASRVLDVRKLHCDISWETIRSESLETAKISSAPVHPSEEGDHRRQWLGFTSKEEEQLSQERHWEEKRRTNSGFKIEEIREGYHHLEDIATTEVQNFIPEECAVQETRKEPHEHAFQETEAKSGDKENNNESKWKELWTRDDQEGN